MVGVLGVSSGISFTFCLQKECLEGNAREREEKPLRKERFFYRTLKTISYARRGLRRSVDV